MARDRQLSRNLWLREFPGWQDATEDDVARLEPTVARVLQPIRSAFGVPLRPTSWRWWSSGEAREGSHSHGGTVDFVLEGEGKTAEAFEWGAQHLIPAGYVGRWIYEPARSGANAQGEHIHMAPLAAMVDVFADSRIQVLEEQEEGSYFLHFEVAPLAWGGLLALGAGVLLFISLAKRRPSFAS